MYLTIEGKVHKEKPAGTYLLVLAPHESLSGEISKISSGGLFKGELRIDDGRCITAEQRKKAYATLADIAMYLGYPPEELKEIMKYRYIAATGEDYLSLSNCSMSTARRFITHILDFALEWGISLMDTLLDRTDDINATVYSSLKHRRCILCGQDGDIHHWDSIGMGHDRDTYDDSKHRKICLCRMHHTEAHRIGRDTFGEKYHLYGIIFNE